MERIGIFSSDPQTRTDIAKWIRELPTEFDLSSLGPTDNGDPEENAASGENDEPTNPQDPIKLIIFDSRTGLNLSEVKASLIATLGLDQNIPWLSIGREEHAKNPHDKSIATTDDLVLLPLDKSVFLQKIEYLLAGADNVTPSFLYFAKTDFPVELAKSVNITQLSETGCSIIAARAVNRGVAGALLCRLVKNGPLERIEVRVAESTPYFETSLASSSPPSAIETTKDQAYEVRLRFFALKQKQLVAIRKWLSEHHSLPDIERSTAEPEKILNLTVISPDSSQTSVVRSALEDLANVDCFSVGGLKTYQGCLMMSQQQKTERANGAPPEWAITWSKKFVGPRPSGILPSLLPSTATTITLRLKSDSEPCKIESFSPALKDHDRILNISSESWSRDASALFQNLTELDREAMEEALQWSTTPSTSRTAQEAELNVQYKVDEFFSLGIKITVSLVEAATPTKPALMKLVLEEAAEDETESAGSGRHRIPTTCEGVMVDASLLKFDARAKILNLEQTLETYGVKNAFGNTPPIVIFNADENQIDPSEFRGTKVRQLVYSFSDRRYHAELFITLSRRELWTSAGFTVVGHKREETAYLATDAMGTGLSEVGLTISGASPMKRGTELLILSPIWSEAPEGLWVRLRSATSKEDKFENEFVFFGASDGVQKQIRKYARLDYVKKKAQGQS